jgi:hypothetical protein
MSGLGIIPYEAKHRMIYNEVTMRQKKGYALSFPQRDRSIFITLILVGLLVRLPFLRTFDLVSYDGTYYIRQAGSILAGAYRPGVFPIGYPAFIALLTPVVRDGVRAAQLVSVLAGTGALVVFFLLCKKLMSRPFAVAASLILATIPLFIHMTTTTMSESLAIFWVLLGLLMFANERDFTAGICLGVASITRPESLAIAGILTLLLLRRPRRMIRFATGCALVYSVGVVIESVARGRLVLLRKSESFGSGSVNWKLREAWIEFGGKERALEDVAREEAETNFVLYYLRRLPREIILLIRHTMPVLFILALYGIWKKRHFTLVLFAPFVIFPLFTSRSEIRFVFPYLPGVILFALIGLEALRSTGMRKSLIALIVISIVTGWWINRDQVTLPVSNGYHWAKQVGAQIAPRIKPGDGFADRKPYLAFYAGGEYIEIPAAPYEEIIEHIYADNIEYLVLHDQTIKNFRPVLLPLLFDRTMIRGELRYAQWAHFPGVLIYRINREVELPEERQIFAGKGDTLYGPVWSPDGSVIACRMHEKTGKGEIRVIDFRTGRSRLILLTSLIDDPISWSPDSKSIAFANYDSGNYDIYISRSSGEIERVTTDKAVDRSPSWSDDGRQIAFCSDRSGQSEVWIKDLDEGRLERMTDLGDCSFPSISPGGRYVAFLRIGDGLYIHDRETLETIRALAPAKVDFKPSWSPDGRTIAVSARDWESMHVYLVTSDGSHAAIMTKAHNNEGQPAWSPDGRFIATVTISGGEMDLWLTDGVDPYIQRLHDPAPVVVVEQ